MDEERGEVDARLRDEYGLVRSGGCRDRGEDVCGGGREAWRAVPGREIGGALPYVAFPGREGDVSADSFGIEISDEAVSRLEKVMDEVLGAGPVGNGTAAETKVAEKVMEPEME